MLQQACCAGLTGATGWEKTSYFIMAEPEKNSLDLLRLVAALLVLYSHQFALMGQPEPSFFGWTSFGGAGITIFFFLSGLLVWSSWQRDPAPGRFLVRRSLRIFPALWVVVFCCVFLVGPAFSSLTVREYFLLPKTWFYLGTAFLIPGSTLPGVFAGNPYPLAVNGSLWTLPLEFMCYISVVIVGVFTVASRGVLIAAAVLLCVVLASMIPMLTGLRFSIHLEMVAVFWWGVLYGHSTKRLPGAKTGSPMALVLGCVAFLLFALWGPRGLERMAMLVCSACLVHLALRVAAGSRLTTSLGDLSYGLYIFAFPVQQMLMHWSTARSLSVESAFCLSLIVTSVLAFGSWHLIEKRALRFKPRTIRTGSM